MYGLNKDIKTINTLVILSTHDDWLWYLFSLYKKSFINLFGESFPAFNIDPKVKTIKAIKEKIHIWFVNLSPKLNINSFYYILYILLYMPMISHILQILLME